MSIHMDLMTDYSSKLGYYGLFNNQVPCSHSDGRIIPPEILQYHVKAAIAESKGREGHEESLEVGEGSLAFNLHSTCALPDLALYNFNVWDNLIECLLLPFT